MVRLKCLLFEETLCLNTGSLTLHLSISHVSSNHQSLQWNVCAAHVNKFSSNLVECIDFSGATVGWSRFLRINHIELKCSFVQCRKYH